MTDSPDLSPFESLLALAGTDPAASEAVFAEIWTETFYVPSGTDVSKEAFRPVLFTRDDGGSMMAVYTALGRIGEDIRAFAPFAFTMTGANVLTGLQGTSGLLINPGSGPALELLPIAVHDLKNRHAG